jgi:raffinose/stachyose/melibiose transport system substrate-binding protein
MALAAAALMTVTLASCSSGGSGDGGKVTISYLTQNDDATIKYSQALIDAFEKANPNITVKLNTQEGGTPGDNLMKTKLSTGTMEDVFHYNSGSLMQALSPDTTLYSVADESWFKDLNLQQTFIDTVSGADGGIYGVPLGTAQSGGVLYNKKVFAELGLEVPTDWAGFIANAEAVKADGRYAPIEQAFGDTWTAQLFVLADFANVSAQDPNWAADYTANKAKYVDQPGLQAFKNQQETFDKGLYNADFASAKNDDAIKAIATGTAAMFPMLTGVTASITANYPDNINDVGFFAMPAQDSADTNATVWQPNVNYIAKTSTGDKLKAALAFVEFQNSTEGCKIQNELLVPSGPYVTDACTLPDTVPDLLKDLQTYFDSGKIGSALEFLSPVKGPNLPAITVQVGSGISSGEEGAALYDDDVKKQAQQLGLPGW